MLTGPPHSGKSTTLDWLKYSWKNPIHPDREHQVLSESAIRLIRTLNQLCGLERCASWRKEYNSAWQALVTSMQVEEEELNRSTKDVDIFIDSSPLDCLAFVEAYGGVADSFLKQHCGYFPDGSPRRYDLVFYHELIQPFDSRAGSGRLQSKEDCLRIGNAQREVYTRYGMPPIYLPPISLQKRVDIIKQAVQDHLIGKFNMQGTTTGRFNSKEPNYSNLPRDKE